MALNPLLVFRKRSGAFLWCKDLLPVVQQEVAGLPGVIVPAGIIPAGIGQARSFQNDPIRPNRRNSTQQLIEKAGILKGDATLSWMFPDLTEKEIMDLTYFQYPDESSQLIGLLMEFIAVR